MDYTRNYSQANIGDGTIRHRVIMKSNTECIRQSVESRILFNKFLDTLLTTPDLTVVGAATTPDIFKLYHDGTFWVLEMESVTNGG